MQKNQVLLATRNQGKLKELSDMLASCKPSVLGLQNFPELGEVEEDSPTFAGNALKKARYAAEHTGLYAIADDSGLVVDALGGAPGVRSARYAERVENGCLIPGNDAANMARLLKELDGVPMAERTARFCCAMAAVSPDGRELLTEGFWEGSIALAPKGSNGFGYDPVFIDSQSGLHAAELSPEEKNARSHRGKALAALLVQWTEFWRPGS